MILSGNKVKEVSSLTYFEHRGMLQEQFDEVYSGTRRVAVHLQTQWQNMLSAYFSLHSRYEVTESLLAEVKQRFTRCTGYNLDHCSKEELAVAGLEAEITALLCEIYSTQTE